ncbi:hypothetical protein [Bacterioplanoides sp. SCSIO 12839]|uniref:hypothetical protein n=1 Tax=Bacterioplanoides sp. SCSIO 12839 TaxID=2829569 RepID=UPI0021053F69|nr:hypothetical protein [Bacterioplanoides sp. SCSIO 12839]UTW49403.1 hypothetical protein KFF03_05745 [Bacterioplanoides sp. SCSIO 12839]
MNRMYVMAIAVSIALTGCGGGGGGGSSDSDTTTPDTTTPDTTTPDTTTPDTTTPDSVVLCGQQSQLIFPAAYSATLSDEITLRGQSNCDQVTALTVNGIAATSSDDFANWQVKVPLTPGLNTLQATVAEGEQTQQLTLGQIESNELLYDPQQVAVSRDGRTLYVFDSDRRQLLKIDTASGARSVVSSTEFPNQDFYFGNVSAITLSQDESQIYLVSRNVNGISNGSFGAVLAVNLTTGMRTVISNPDVAGQDNFRNAESMVHDVANQRLILSSGTNIYTVDLSSNNLGAQTLISSNTVPNADNPFSVTVISLPGNNSFTIEHGLALALDSDNQRLIVSDKGSGMDNDEQILAVNLDINGTVGARTVISAAKDEWNQLGHIVLKDSDTAYLYELAFDDGDAIYSVDLNSGDATVLIENGTQTGITQLRSNFGYLAYSATSDTLFTVAEQQRSVFAINVAEKRYSELAENLATSVTGLTSTFDDLSRNALDPVNQHLYLEDDDENILRLNLATGERTSLAKDIGAGAGGNYIESMAFDSALSAVVVTGYRTPSNSDRIGYATAFSVTDGNPTVITDSTLDTGSELDRPWGWLRLDNNSSIVVDDTSSPSQFYRTDITTGMRTLIYVDLTELVNLGSSFEAENVAISADKKTIYITDDSGNAGVYQLDLTTNKITVITDATTPGDGNALRFSDPESIALSSDGKYAYVGDNSISALVKVNLATGAREALIQDEITSTNSWAERIQGIAVDTQKQLIYTSCDNADVVLMIDELTKEWVMIAE